jgi:hypothetical protein
MRFVGSTIAKRLRRLALRRRQSTSPARDAKRFCSRADATRRSTTGRALYTVQISQRDEASGFFMGLEDICINNDTTLAAWRIAMQSGRQIDFDELDVALQSARTLSPSLFRKVMRGCERLDAFRQSGRATTLDELTEAGAWTDATLHLLALELPQWTIRRLFHEGEDWLCTLSRHPNLPITLDDLVEALHAALPLAILRALLEARRRLSMEVTPAVRIPQSRSENFLSRMNRM